MSDHNNINNFKNQFLDIYNPERTKEVALNRVINAAVQRNKLYKTKSKKENLSTVNLIHQLWSCFMTK